MNTDNKKILQETRRWLRVGFLTVTVLGPVVNTLSSLLRERAAALRDEAAKRGTNAYTQSQERLAPVGASLAESLSELKEHPYSQELIKRGSDLTEDLVDRGTKLSQVVAKRSEQVGRDLAERSSDALQELAERSEKASRELAKQGKQVSKAITKQSAKVSNEVTKRSQRAAKDIRKRTRRAQRQLAKRTEQLTQQNMRRSTPLWAIPSFSISLIAAGIAAYLLVRKRLQQQKSQSEPFSQNGYLNGTAPSTTSSTAYFNSQPTFKTVEPANGATSIQTPVEPIVEPLTVEPTPEEYEAETEKMPAISLSSIVKESPTVEETPLLQAETIEQQEETPVLQTATTDQQGGDNPLMATSILEQPVAVAPVEEVAVSESAPIQSTQTDAEATEQRKPAVTIIDAAFLGVVGTQHYYPIETPLNELQSAEGGTLDVIYFATEDEAKAQGYTAAS